MNTDKAQPKIGPMPKCDGCGKPITGYHLILSQSNGGKPMLAHSWECLRAIEADGPVDA